MQLVTEMRFDGRCKFQSTGFEQIGFFAVFKCTFQRGKSEKTRIRQRGGAEVGITRREAVFQLIGVGCDDTCTVFLPLAVFRAPFDGGEKLLCDGFVARGQRITRCT